MSISLEGITKSFGAERVLDGLTEVVPAGTLTALLGASGSGKSTLLRIIAGLTTPDGGRVLFDGRDVTSLAPRHRRIGFCFQDYAPFWHLSVAENVAYGLKAQRVARDQRRRQVDDLLSLVRLESFADRYPRQLSGGQRQRMALARALAVRPEVLLLDEPFAALDAQVRTELRAWVRELQREVGITTILVTHDQAEAMEVADRLVILHQGRVEQAGTPDEVYDHPESEFVRAFLGPTTTLGGVTFRPHQLDLVGPGEGGTPVVVTDVTRLGFEVRVTVVDGGGNRTWVQLTHEEARRRGPRPGDAAAVRPRAPFAVSGAEAHPRRPGVVTP